MEGEQETDEIKEERCGDITAAAAAVFTPGREMASEALKALHRCYSVR